MIFNCVWEHNGDDTLLYCVDLAGAYARGESLEVAKKKMPREISSYLRWLGEEIPSEIEIAIVQEKESKLSKIADVCIRVPQKETYMVQELHLPVYHTLCLMLEERFFGGK